MAPKLQTLLLPRATNALAELQSKLPRGARVLWVRYTRENLIALFHAPSRFATS